MTIARQFSLCRLKIAFTAGLIALFTTVEPVIAPASAQIVIAHRGASGERPEHTLAAYELAIDQGADYIEPDLVVTKDFVLVARHENELSDTTDVASRDEFSDRRRSKTIDGELVSGWFVEDFTLAELRTLRAKERIAGLRPANARFDGLYQIPTFDEIVTLVKAKEAETGRTIGIYPEIKHPSWLLQEGFDTVDLLVGALRKAGLDKPDSKVFIQSFDVAPLKRLDRMVDVPLVQLIANEGGPADEPGMYYGDMVTPAGFAEIATYADAVGIDSRMLFGPDGIPLDMVDLAHEAGLKVHAWTLRKENAFLPPVLRRGTSEGDTGDVLGAYSLLKMLGVDGIFTDDPGLVIAARKEAE